MTEIMKKNELHCGPLAIARALNISSNEVMRLWPSKWIDKEDDRNSLGLPIDTHWHHKAYLKGIGKKMMPLRLPEPGAICLLSFSFFSRHWCRVHSASSKEVIIDMLTGEFRMYSVSAFKELVKPWPNCMYKIESGEQELTWFDKLMIKVL